MLPPEKTYFLPFVAFASTASSNAEKAAHAATRALTAMGTGNCENRGESVFATLSAAEDAFNAASKSFAALRDVCSAYMMADDAADSSNRAAADAKSGADLASATPLVRVTGSTATPPAHDC
jgi:hypothetical protein